MRRAYECGDGNDSGTMRSPRVEILSFAGCPNTGALSSRLYRSDEGPSELARREWVVQALVR